eukprot:4495821-Pyramimonas_sp.AAC.2
MITRPAQALSRPLGVHGDGRRGGRWIPDRWVPRGAGVRKLCKKSRCPKAAPSVRNHLPQ